MAEEHTKDAEAEISEEVSRVQGEYYGRPPEDARTYYIPGEMVMVVLTETFTNAEKVMIENGGGSEIQSLRRRFQQINADQFISIVEQTTGETVGSFLSETSIEGRVSVEVFLLGPPRTDMESFETAKTRLPEET